MAQATTASRTRSQARDVHDEDSFGSVSEAGFRWFIIVTPVTFIALLTLLITVTIER